MNKKVLALVAIVALGIGGVSAIALQSHAEQLVTQPATPSTVQSTSTQDISSPSDTDNIQDDKGGVDKPDPVIDNHQDGETNDDATSTISQKKDAKEQSEGTATDAAEVEDAN